MTGRKPSVTNRSGARSTSGLCRYGPCVRWPLTGPHHLIPRGMEQPAQVRCCLLESLAADRGIEQSGKELADLGEDGDQPLMERIHDTRYYG